MGGGILATIFFFALFGICNAIQGSKDDKLTNESKEVAEKNGWSTYYDYNISCTRSTMTGERGIKLYGRDVDGKTYTYIATKPKFGPQKIRDIRYLDPRDGDVVKVKPEDLEEWRRKGQL